MNNSIYLQSNFAKCTPFFDPVHRPGKCATRKLWRCASLDIEIAVKWLSTYQHSWHICKHRLFSDIWTIKRVILLLVNRDLKICLAYTVIWHTIRLRLFHIGWSNFIQRRRMEFQQPMYDVKEFEAKESHLPLACDSSGKAKLIEIKCCTV